MRELSTDPGRSARGLRRSLSNPRADHFKSGDTRIESSIPDCDRGVERVDTGGGAVFGFRIVVTRYNICLHSDRRRVGNDVDC